MIVNERIVSYIHSLEKSNGPLLDEMEAYAKENRVPIIRKEVESFLRVLLEMQHPTHILELGTAIGYSAILMGGCIDENSRITTIENYEKRIPIARENIKNAGMEDKITVVQGDALEEMKKVFEAEKIDAEIVQVGNKEVRGCIACGRCAELGKCVFDDVVNELAPKFEEADGLVIASPVYYASANATLIAVLDRLFYSSHFDKAMKVGASVVCARRGGCSATFDELNKYFTICNMPIASSQYWNSIHGRGPGEASEDEEGKQTMRVLARNMAFLMKSIALGKEQFGLPETEEHVWTHFIR